MIPPGSPDAPPGSPPPPQQTNAAAGPRHRRAINQPPQASRSNRDSQRYPVVRCARTPQPPAEANIPPASRAAQTDSATPPNTTSEGRQRTLHHSSLHCVLGTSTSTRLAGGPDKDVSRRAGVWSIHLAQAVDTRTWDGAGHRGPAGMTSPEPQTTFIGSTHASGKVEPADISRRCRR